MVDLNLIKNVGLKVVGQVSMFWMTHNADILTGIGVVGSGGTIILARKAALQEKAVIDHSNIEIASIKDLRKEASKENYSDAEYNRDIFIAHVKKIGAVGRLYAPALIVGTISVGSILWGHNILTKKNLGLVGAYGLLDQSYKKYRSRVVKELGEEKDRDFRYGKDSEQKEEITETSFVESDGTKVEIRKIRKPRPEGYAVIFDAYSPQWKGSDFYNRQTIQTAQNYLNDRLFSRGFVLLNEAYEALGLPITEAGCIVGWLYKSTTPGHGYIDITIKGDTDEDDELILDFNPDGVIYNRLP
jgi:Family of unknown function (DUF6353)